MKVITSEFRAMNKLKIKEETYKWLALDKKVDSLSIHLYCMLQHSKVNLSIAGAGPPLLLLVGRQEKTVRRQDALHFTLLPCG